VEQDLKRLPQDFYAGDLFGEIYHAEAEPEKARPSRYIPGLAVCLTAALAAAWLAEHYAFPLILLGLLIGLALSFVSEDARTHAGLDFASREGLRVGIVLLGLQVTLAQVMAIGWLPFIALVVVMAGAMLAGLATSLAIGEGREAGVLAGGATAICGASAALAIYGVIGQSRLSQTRFSITLVGVALASAIAMTTYPVLARVLGLDDAQAGFLIGASVHDVAQAIGGGYSFSDEAGQDATIIKLARVAMLAPVVGLVALWIGGEKDSGAQAPRWKAIALPWFITGFLLLVAFGSFITIPNAVGEWGLVASKGLLLLAVTAAAMRSRLGLILEAGWRPLLPVFAATLASFVVSLVMVLLVLG
jgi:uncharacterized integral membrane protein (TIGR00698 family)